MGGIPKTAMNLVGFPLKTMDISVLRRILEGGIEKLKEAGVVLAGGHSIENDELFYGLSVTGFVHPEQMLLKKNPVVGDRLILTKPLGTGIVNTAIKAGLADKETIIELSRLMATLNKRTAQIMRDYPVHACTDITGFGLLGHIAEMIVDAGVGVQIMADRLPVIPEALEFAKMGLIPAGAYKNLEFRQSMTEISSTIDRARQDILFDPQTSGGLLISLNASHAETLQKKLVAEGITFATIIGEIVAKPAGKIRVL
jgi:selenide,water dikinase